MSSSASSSYNSLQVSVQHTEKYANFLIGYTWSKSMDNGSGVFDPTNVFNPASSRALSTFDVPQNLVISYTVQLPFNNFIGKGDAAPSALPQAGRCLESPALSPASLCSWARMTTFL